jgi:hypothetical protein
MSRLFGSGSLLGTGDFFLDKELHKIIKDSIGEQVEGNVIKTEGLKVFNNFRDAWLMCVALGFRSNNKIKSEPETLQKVASFSYISDSDQVSFLVNIALLDYIKVKNNIGSPDYNLFDLFDKEKVKISQVCQEYANGGAKELLNIMSGFDSPLENTSINLIDLLESLDDSSKVTGTEFVTGPQENNISRPNIN